VFERVVGACIGAGLVGGEGFAVDASLIVADASMGTVRMPAGAFPVRVNSPRWSGLPISSGPTT
jgi:hypothetical protein